MSVFACLSHHNWHENAALCLQYEYCLDSHVLFIDLGLQVALVICPLLLLLELI